MDEPTDGQIVGRTNRPTDRPTDREMNRQTDGQTEDSNELPPTITISGVRSDTCHKLATGDKKHVTHRRHDL